MKTRLFFISVMLLSLLPSMVFSQGAAPGNVNPMVKGVLDVTPLIPSKWGQGCLYNASCPVDTASHATCLHVPSGSGAIAMAQIMNYYKFPVHGTGEHGYTHPKYGIQYANFGATTYNWSSMPDSLQGSNEALATLIYQCGVAQNMSYGPTVSSSLSDDIDSALVKYFGFSKSANWKSKSEYNDSEWITMVRTELDAARPLLFSAYDLLGRPQFFICDGYQAGDMFHFNWGLGGADDGYFTMNQLMPDTLGLLVDKRALFNLSPALPNPGSFVMDFENVPDFSLTFNDWGVLDADQKDTYIIPGHTFPHQGEPMAFLSFNPSLVTPSMASDQAIQPHSGQRFGACFSSNPSPNNDWFISPKIQLGTNGSFSFWIKSYNDTFKVDDYFVAVSTTDNNPASFTSITGTDTLHTTTEWMKKTFSLNSYNNQRVYVAIHCVSNDHLLMMIDDLEVKPEASSTLSADFTASKLSVRVGESVNFTDLSSGSPTSWSWMFTGGTPATSNQQNPMGIRYSVPGLYAVSLKVSNGSVTDSITKTAYINVTGYPSSISLDFESLSDFSMAFNPWTLIDVRGGNTWGIDGVFFPNNYVPMAYICFNPTKTTPPLVNMQAHSGEKLGCSFSSTPPLNPNDKWLISPKMSLGFNPQADFWVKTYNPQWGDEKYNLAVSVTDLNPASFVPVNANPEIAPTNWTKRIYDLSEYTNKDVYIGIQCVTDNCFIFMLDDISISSTVGIGEVNSLDRLVIFPNPAKNYLILNCPSGENNVMTIDMISILGEKISSWHKTPVSQKIMLDIRNIPNGVYLLRITNGQEQVTRKISITN